ncbi:MAG TPA: hypothetical protein PKI22_06100 [Hydrogenophilus thermoluteolus]|nr:hypothetical protein [Hydrogenophilus thermoluteolus]
MTDALPTHNPPTPALAALRDALACFTDALTHVRFWHILPQTGNDPIGLFDCATGLRYLALPQFQAFLKDHPFLHLVTASGEKTQITLESATRRLWYAGCSILNGRKRYALDEAKALLETAQWGGLEGWGLPTKAELYRFCTTEGNPYRRGGKYRLQSGNGASAYWLVPSGPVDVDEGYWSIGNGYGALLPKNNVWTQLSDDALLLALIARNWRLVTPDGKAHLEPNSTWQHCTPQQLMFALAASGARLASLDGKTVFAFAPHPALAILGDCDHRVSRLPRLELVQLTDPHKGLWELWGAPDGELREWGMVARNPAADVRDHPVAIDFGTSSTVVAIDEGAHKRLVRVGVRDFYQPITPGDFENPTVIELVDYPRFAALWQRDPYRPPLEWDWLRIGHEAQASWRDNAGNPAVIGSILPRLKLWAARPDHLPPLQITDRSNGHTVTLAPPSERLPVRGQPLEVGPSDPFDPIEYYAFQLGMVINWRGSGIHREYYLSFPAKYDQATRKRIRASFARGLQRSLPATLIAQGQILNEFKVEMLASEPVAYAAAALPALGLTPTAEGVTYAVFDFGGGTTDFDFGLWRLPTPEEEDQGYEEVFEHFASSGDNTLGGEQLLEHLAYRVFVANLEVLRDKRIHFTQPVDASLQPGTEAFIQPTQAAQTNTAMLMNRLRPFWEGDKPEFAAQIKIDLLDAYGMKQPVELAVDAEALEQFLSERIAQGVALFLRELARNLDEHTPTPIHVLLAGNASRARHVRAAFDPNEARWAQLLAEVFGEAPPEIIVHQPLPIDPERPYGPTAKTGVALGLLRLVPGQGVKTVDHVRTRNDGEAPFAWYVGHGRKRRFVAALTPHTPYGQWRELGPVVDGVFNLYATQSRRAEAELALTDPEIQRQRLSYADAAPGMRLWARIVAPNAIEVALGNASEPPRASAPHHRITLHK